jgi:hypothetical protein
MFDTLAIAMHMAMKLELRARQAEASKRLCEDMETARLETVAHNSYSSES